MVMVMVTVILMVMAIHCCQPTHTGANRRQSRALPRTLSGEHRPPRAESSHPSSQKKCSELINHRLRWLCLPTPLNIRTLSTSRATWVPGSALPSGSNLAPSKADTAPSHDQLSEALEE